MRIALDATYSVDAHPSGIAVYSRRLLDGLAAAYPDDQFLHCYRPKQFLRREKSHVRNVSHSPLLWRVPYGNDIFHALNQRLDRRYARRNVATFHDLFVMTGEYSTPEFRKRFTDQASRAAERADLIITVSEFTARQVHDLLGVEFARLRPVPHGVDLLPESDPALRERLVLFVGALQVRKNVERMISAFEELDASWRFVLAGAPNGHGAAAILSRIQASPARNRIEVAGYVSDEQLEALYQRASIFLFPSLDEGFGIPALEAMARGVPLITSNGSALVEVAGAEALLVNPHETDEISYALHELGGDPDLRARLASKGRERAAGFSWENAVRKTYEVYREVSR